LLPEHRDMDTATRFFKSAKEVIGCEPERVTTYGYNSYSRAIRRVLGRKVLHRINRLALMELPYYQLEQDHRGIKQRYYSSKSYEV
jgi:transposase-like protein